MAGVGSVSTAVIKSGQYSDVIDLLTLVTL